MTSPGGLRERKKAATKAALSAAAIELAAAQGLNAATAEAIAAAAGVSPRTFHNYFASKEDAIIHGLESSSDELVGLFDGRPSDEPIWDSVEAATVEFLSDPDRNLIAVGTLGKIIAESPALMARAQLHHETIGRRVAAAVAQRTGTDADSDLHPNLLSMCVGAAVCAAIEMSVTEAGASKTPAEWAADAFAQIRQGLPAPPRS